MYDFRAIDRSWNRLPRAGVPGLDARWLGPLVDKGLDGWLGDLSQGAYEILEDCGWLSDIRAAPPMLDDDGGFDPGWIACIQKAAQSLADAGAYAGPESEVERWTSWLLWELAEPHAWIRERIDGR